MTVDEKRRYEMLVRVRNFGAAHRQLFPDTSSASAAFAAIAAELPQLEALDVAERVASHSARAARKKQARKQLMECLTRAKNTARALVKTIPELAAHVDLPAKLDDRLLMTMARQFETAITPHAEAFAAHGIAIAQLGGLIAPFETAISERRQRRGEKAEARARIIPSMARAIEALDMLDLTVPNHLAGDPVMLNAWRRDRHVKPRRSRAVAEAETPAAEGTTVTESADAIDKAA